jgi:glycosyltransferase involved in cell wall biosynthesis
MRLGINTLFLVPGDVGGTETYLRETLLASLAEYPEVEVVLFTNNENAGFFKKMCAGHSKVSFVCLNFNASNRPLRIIFEQIKLPLAVRKAKLDILWSPGYTAPFFSSCPQVVTVCDLQYKSYPEDMTALERLTLDFLVRGACRRCNAVLAISEFSRKEILRYNFAGADRVHAVLLGVDDSFALSAPEEERAKGLAKLLAAPAIPYILCVAHTYPHKKVDHLVKAFAALQTKIPHQLVLVGRPRRGDDEVRRAVADLSDDSRITRFQDGLPYRDLQLLYQAADMFVLPSAYEGFGLPVLEAMMAGTPVITTREASLPEVAGSRAFFVDEIKPEAFAEQILRVIALSPEDRSQQTVAARTWARSFTWQRSMKKMFAVFSAVVDQNNKI